MKNKFFSSRLYLETMRELRLPAWILTGIICVITGTADFITAYNTENWDALPSILEFAPGLWVFMYVAPLLFTALSFGFLNSRRDSDFYHSLPNTRQSLFFSRMAAVMTMTFGGIVATCLVSLIGRLVWQMPINMISYLYIILFNTVASMVIASGVALAMSITGTKLSNAVAILLIVFFPRLILYITAAFMESVAPVLVMSEMGVLFSFRYNLAFAPLGLIEMKEDIMTFWPGILYSFGLSIAYTALGLWAFVRRRSETADKAAPNRKLHRVYALALATPLALLATDLIADTSHWDNNIFSLIVVLAVLDFLIYMVYEMVTIKSFKKGFRALPALLVLFLVCGGVSVGSRTIAIAGMNRIPDEDQVKSIRVSSETDIFTSMLSSEPTYNELLQEKAMLTNRDLIDVTLKVLKKDVNAIKNGTYYGYPELAVKFYLKNGTTVTRQIDISDQIDEYRKYLLADQAYKDAASAYPSEKEIKNWAIEGFAEKDPAKEPLLPTFLEELGAMTDDERVEYFGYMGYENFANMTVSGYLKTETFSNRYSLDMHVPRTSQKYIDLCYQKNKADIDKLLKGYLDGTTQEGMGLNIAWYELSDKEMSNLTNMYYSNYEMAYSSEDKFYGKPTEYEPAEIETIKYAANILQNTELRKADISKENMVVVITISGFDTFAGEYTSYTIWAQCTEELKQMRLDLEELWKGHDIVE